MPDRGKIVVGSILLVALVMAVFAWNWNYNRGRKSMEFWGREAAVLIRQAPQVELWRLAADNDSQAVVERITVSRTPLAVVERTDISRAQGLLHARFALTEDASFDFSDSRPAQKPQWDYAVRFTRDGRTATVLFDFTNSRVGIAEQNRAARAVPKIIEGWQQFVARHGAEK